MNIQIFVPKTKKNASYHTDAQNEYIKRLSRYCKIKRINVKNRDDLLKKLPSSSHVFHIAPSYAPLSSEELSEKISSLGVSGVSDLTFVIGDFEAFQSHEQFSLSTAPLPVELEITIFYEQLYRAYRILRGEPYHK